MSDAFDQAWVLAKESGPPLNYFDFDNDPSMPMEGWQDFRFVSADNELPPAGNFPDRSGYYPTRRIIREPSGMTRVTADPAGSNINLTPMAHAMHTRFYGDGEGGLSDEGENHIISDLASTGQHEAIHQAVHSILADMGYKPGGPYGGTPDEREKYERATEWAANLGQHHDVRDAWNQLRSHPVFRDDEEVGELADMYIDRDYDLNNEDLFPEERGGWERTIR